MTLTNFVRSWRQRPRSRRRGRPVLIRPKPRVEELESRELFAGSSVLTDINYVAGLYYEVLHRRPSSPEVSGWNGLLASGAGRAAVAAGFIGSAEYQAHVIQGDYQTILHRNPDAGGFQSWLQQMQGGTNAQQAMAMFLSSDEYYSNHGSNINGWLAGVYQDMLGRPPDAFGIANWSAVLLTGVPRDAVAMGIVRSREALSRQVAKAYRDVLGRAPDASGANSWTASMMSGLTTEQLLVGLAASQEFYDQQKGVGFDISAASGRYQPFRGDPRLPPRHSGVDLSGLAGGPQNQRGPGGGGTGGNGGGGAGDFGPGGPSGPDGGGPGGDRGGGQSGGGSGGSGPGGAGGGSSQGGGTSGSLVPRTPGVNVDVSQLPLIDFSEISLAVNPTNPQNIVVAGTPLNIAFPLYLSVFSTMDGGSTWSFVRVGSVVDGITSVGVQRGDPELAFDATGRLYFAYVMIDFQALRSGIAVARSTDGGRNFTASFAILESATVAFNDKEILATGPDPVNPAQQDVYVAWVRLGPDRIMISGSTNGGVTWSTPTPVSSTAHIVSPGGVHGVQFASPSVGPNGEINVTFYDLDFGQIFFSTSPTFNNGAFAFGPERLAGTVNDPTFDQSVPAQPGRGIAVLPVSATDRSNGPNRGRTYIAYTDLPRGGARPNYDIFVISSSDSGVTWSNPVQVNDDTDPNTHFNPAISLNQDGTVGLAWRDTRDDPVINRLVNIYTATSIDGGRTFSPNLRVSNNSSDDSIHNNPQTDNNFLEYDGFQIFNGIGYYAWSDNSANPNRNKAIFFDTKQLPTVVSRTGNPPFVIRPRDRFDPNDTSDTATLLASMPQTQAGLRITRHADGVFDNDWFRLSAFGSSITVTINYTTFDGGDLHLRVFTLDAQGTLIQLGSSRATGVRSQTVTVGTAPGQPILIWVYGFNHSEGDYDLTIA